MTLPSATRAKFQRSAVSSACGVIGTVSLLGGALSLLGAVFSFATTDLSSLGLTLGGVFVCGALAAFFFGLSEHLDRQREVSVLLGTLVAQLERLDERTTPAAVVDPELAP